MGSEKSSRLVRLPNVRRGGETSGMGRPRSQAQRDATTVEIGYALASAVFLGAVVFGVVAGPAVVWRLPHGLERLLVATGAVLACLLAALRVVLVLRQHARRLRETDQLDQLYYGDGDHER
jgi:nitric oxide reductase large subunit